MQVWKRCNSFIEFWTLLQDFLCLQLWRRNFRRDICLFAARWCHSTHFSRVHARGPTNWSDDLVYPGRISSRFVDIPWRPGPNNEHLKIVFMGISQVTSVYSLILNITRIDRGNTEWSGCNRWWVAGMGKTRFL